MPRLRGLLRPKGAEGRDVYGLAILSLLRSSVGGAQSLLPARQSFRCPVSLLRSEIFAGAIVAINISLLWSENEFHFALPT